MEGIKPTPRSDFAVVARRLRRLRSLERRAKGVELRGFMGCWKLEVEKRRAKDVELRGGRVVGWKYSLGL